MANVCYGLPALPLAGLGAAGIVTGGLLVSRASEKVGSADLKVPGTIAYVLGWLVLVAAVSQRYVKTSTCLKSEFNWTSFIWAGLPALIVMGTTIGTYMVSLSDETKQYAMYNLVAFTVAWTIFTVGMTFKNGTFNSRVLAGMVGSGIALLAGMWFLGRESGTFNLGVPLYILGWVGTALTASVIGSCDTCAIGSYE